MLCTLVRTAQYQKIPWSSAMWQSQHRKWRLITIVKRGATTLLREFNSVKYFAQHFWISLSHVSLSQVYYVKECLCIKVRPDYHSKSLADFSFWYTGVRVINISWSISSLRCQAVCFLYLVREIGIWRNKTSYTTNSFKESLLREVLPLC